MSVMRPRLPSILLLAALFTCSCDDDPTRVVPPPPTDSCIELAEHTVSLAVIRPSGRVFDCDANLTHVFASTESDGVFAASILAPDVILPSPVLAALTDARAVDVRDELLFVANGNDGLAILDVSNPASAVLLGSVEMPGRAVDVFAGVEFVYVANDETGLVIVDAGNPAEPVISGIENTPGRAVGVAAEGSIAYVADELLGVRVVNVADPSSPFLIRALSVEGTALAVAVENDHVAVAAREGGLTLIDATDPASAYVASQTYWNVDALDVAFANGIAYVASAGVGVDVVDVTRLNAPQLVHRIGVASYAQSVKVAGDQLVVGDDIAGVRVLGIGQTATSPKVISTPDGGNANAMVPFGDLVVTADEGFGLRIINPVAGAVVGSVAIGGAPIDVFIADTLAYVTTRNAGVVEVSIANPAVPVALRTVPGSFGYDACVVADGFIYLLASFGTVVERRLDGTGFPRDFVGIDAYFPSIAVDGPNLYLPDRRGNVWVVLRTSMTLAAILPVGGSAERVLIRYEQGPFIPLQRVYVAVSGLTNGQAAVEKWDFTVLFSPVLLSRVAVGGNAVDIAIEDALMLVGEGEDGAELFDLSGGGATAVGLLLGPVARVALVDGLVVLGAATTGVTTVKPGECLR